jgi:hypothetical protein
MDLLFNDQALEFFNFMINLDFKDSILRLPVGKTFPVEFGEECAGILIERPLYHKRIKIISSYKDNTAAKYKCVIFIGPPGAGKVCNYQLLYIFMYTNLFVKLLKYLYI